MSAAVEKIPASRIADLDRLLSVREVCALMNVSRATVYNFLSAGVLQGVKIGRSRRFRTSEVEAYIARSAAA